MKFTKRLFAAMMAMALLMTTVFAMVGCQGATTDDLKAVKDAGKIVVGITEYAPMDYRDENGEWTGFDAEFARLFAKELGVDIEFKVIEWDNKLFEVQSGAIDCIWNGMTILPEITEACSVSDPYVKNQQVVVMKADAVAKYTTEDSLKTLTFAVESGSAGEGAIKDIAKELIGVSAQSDALLEVASGSADACVIDATMAASMTGEGTSYENLAVAMQLTNEEYGVAFRKGSNLCEEFNKFMDKLVNDGTLRDLAAKYKLVLAADAQ